MPQNYIGVSVTTVSKRIPITKYVVPAGKLKGCIVVNLSGMLRFFYISHFRPGNPAPTPSTAGVKTNAIKF